MLLEKALLVAKLESNPPGVMIKVYKNISVVFSNFGISQSLFFANTAGEFFQSH